MPFHCWVVLVCRQLSRHVCGLTRAFVGLLRWGCCVWVCSHWWVYSIWLVACLFLSLDAGRLFLSVHVCRFVCASTCEFSLNAACFISCWDHCVCLGVLLYGLNPVTSILILSLIHCPLFCSGDILRKWLKGVEQIEEEKGSSGVGTMNSHLNLVSRYWHSLLCRLLPRCGVCVCVIQQNCRKLPCWRLVVVTFFFFCLLPIIRMCTASKTAGGSVNTRVCVHFM